MNEMPEVEFTFWKGQETGEREYRHAYYLAGMRGTVQFVFMSYEHAGVQREFAADLGYHSPKPMYENHEPLGNKGECHALRRPWTDSYCYYDGSGLNAERVWEAFLAAGRDEEVIQTHLRDFYFDVFYDGAWEADTDAGPYLTPQEREDRMYEGMRAMIEVNPTPELQQLLADYDAKRKERDDAAAGGW